MKRNTVFDIIEYDYKHQSLWSTAYDALMMVLIIVSIVPLMFREETVAFMWMDQIAVCFFIIDYFLRWITEDL